MAVNGRPDTIRTIVLSHDISSNALGRALSMALVAQELGEVQVCAFGSGRLWPGASQFDLDVNRIGRHWKREIDAVMSASADTTLVWVCKGISPLARVVTYLKDRYPGNIVIADFDDDDAGLAHEFFKSTVLNRIRLLRNRSMLPWVIRRSQRKIIDLADGFTFASNSVAAAFPSNRGPSARIPHVRLDSTGIAPTNLVNSIVKPGVSGSIKFGVYGTLRAHKGGSLVLEAIRSHPELHLFTFENCGLEDRLVTDVNWTEISPSTPLDKAYAEIDVAVIAITSLHQSAQMQFPAKLVDAMRAGVAIVATGTSAVREYAMSSFLELPSDASVDDLVNLVKAAYKSGLGREARLIYESELTPVSAGKNLQRLFDESRDSVLSSVKG
ncbi:hypothetical protein [Rhodococcus sp. 24CO]|uniref:hypothetical protein n=1 Tax=Rhodococcus sp. 24CO TaxID=3117460 RepID=UPI003D343364